MHRTPFQHPQATHPAGQVIGYRRNGAPIHVIAGGSGEGEGGSGSGSTEQGAGSTGSTEQGGAAGTAQTGEQGTSQGEAETDWKARAREWERRAKDNKTAADELATLKASQMSEQEKAVTAAEKAGRTAAATEYGAKLAAAEFRAAVSAAGINLGEAADLIDTSKFVGADGEVDTDGITAAVKKLAKLAPRGAGRSGADMGGSGGSGDQPSIDKQIAEATARRDFKTVIQLKRQKAAQTR
ncbi:hypothetical protein ACFY8P_35400 [Streptomyces sp. NPDC012693]|uniref:hypothetical protein n=1 Tax=Streptomyces sp. NPDC012693 TaxID=3364844 RepID=UPI0036CE16B9